MEATLVVWLRDSLRAHPGDVGRGTMHNIVSLVSGGIDVALAPGSVQALHR